MSSPSNKKPYIITLVGPNASGKTSLAIKLAKKFGGEIISADSRQVYRGMDIGTGKATKKEQKKVKHHLLDVAKPSTSYNVSHFKKQATKEIINIIKKGKVPFIVGGTGFWIQAVIDDLELPAVKPDKKLRAKLIKKTNAQLLILLKKLDPVRAQTIDINNPYRLIRAIEIIKKTNKPIPKLKTNTPYNTLILGITHPREILNKRIDIRLKKRLASGIIKEVTKLHRQGVSWSWLNKIGLEYRYISLYLQKKLSYPEMIEQLKTAIYHYAKRQMTWFKRDKRIKWIKTQRQAEVKIEKHLLTKNIK